MNNIIDSCLVFQVAESISKQQQLTLKRIQKRLLQRQLPASRFPIKSESLPPYWRILLRSQFLQKVECLHHLPTNWLKLRFLRHPHQSLQPASATSILKCALFHRKSTQPTIEFRLELAAHQVVQVRNRKKPVTGLKYRLVLNAAPCHCSFFLFNPLLVVSCCKKFQ